MARIPASHVDDVLTRTDLVALVKERVALTPAGRDFHGRCPFHEEKTASFNVVPTKGFYHCFGCGAHGNAADFLMRLDHIGFRDAIAELGRRAGVQPPADTQPPATAVPAETTATVAAVAAAAVHFSDSLANSAAATAYLAKRNLTAETIAAFGLGYAADRWDALKSRLLASGHSIEAIERAGLVARTKTGRRIDRFRDRIIFPIHDAGGRPVGFGGRAVGDAIPKYLNSPDSALFHKGKHLYGLSHALKSPATRQHLIVVEGFIDVLQLAQAGYANTAATMGTAATPDQVALALRHTRRVTFCFDGDRAGRDAAYKAMLAVLPQVGDDHTVDFVFLPDGEDPDGLVDRNGAKAFQAALDRAQPLGEYFFESHLAGGLDLSTIDGRAALVARAAPILDSMRDGPLRALMQKHLAALAGEGVDAVLQLYLSVVSNALIERLLSDGFAMTPADVIERALALALRDPQ